MRDQNKVLGLTVAAAVSEAMQALALGWAVTLLRYILSPSAAQGTAGAWVKLSPSDHRCAAVTSDSRSVPNSVLGTDFDSAEPRVVGSDGG